MTTIVIILSLSLSLIPCGQGQRGDEVIGGGWCGCWCGCIRCVGVKCVHGVQVIIIGEIAVCIHIPGQVEGGRDIPSAIRGRGMGGCKGRCRGGYMAGRGRGGCRGGCRQGRVLHQHTIGVCAVTTHLSLGDGHLGDGLDVCHRHGCDDGPRAGP